MRPLLAGLLVSAVASSIAAALSMAAASPAAPTSTSNAPAAQPSPPADSASVMALLKGVTNRACPLPGVATGGQPAESHLRSLARANFRVVVDNRGPDEPRGFDEPAALRAAGLRLVSIPVTSSGSYTDESFEAFRRTMNAHATQGVFVHCSSGNRSGAFMVAWLVLDRGWDLERAIASARAGGLRSAELESKARAYVARMRGARRP